MAQYNGKEKKHSENPYHQEAVTLALATVDSFKISESRIPALIDNFVKERYETYPKVVHTILRDIHLIGKQDIALRGHREELNDSKPNNNPGNFLSIVTVIAQYYPVLQEHLEELLDGVKKAGIHSISVNEATPSSQFA